ncbi:hypothetical protein ACI65C_006876 [Semiaphis heraclei]
MIKKTYENHIILWKCSKTSSLKCFANFTTSLELVGPNVWSKLNRDHSHLPNESLVIAEKIKCNMKQQAKITSKLPGQIFSETVINQPKEVLYQLPCENSIKRTLRKQRTGNHPNDGNCDDLKTLKVEGEWALYHNENLLLHDNGTDAEERILVFGTESKLYHNDKNVKQLTVGQRWQKNFSKTEDYDETVKMSKNIYDRAIEKLKDLVSYNLSEVCSDKEEFYKSQRKLRAKRKIFSSEDDLSDSGNKSPLLFESDSDATNISTPQKNQIAINEGPQLIGEGIPIQNSSKNSPSRSHNRELINSEHTSLRVPNNTELILRELLKGKTIIMQKLDQIMESQISITMEHRNSSNDILNTDNMFSRKFKDMFPMTNNDEILKVENSFNDHDFYQYVAQRLQFTGGMCLQQFVTRVMDTLFSGSIFVALTFSGRNMKRDDPEKLGFSKLMLYRLICQGYALSLVVTRVSSNFVTRLQLLHLPGVLPPATYYAQYSTLTIN